MDEEKNIKVKFINLILENGVSLSLAVSFCIAIYFIVHQQNVDLLKAVYELREDKKELIDDLIECYKISN